MPELNCVQHGLNCDRIARKALPRMRSNSGIITKHPYSQLKWCIAQKPKLRDDYVLGRINEELNEVLLEADDTFEKFSSEYVVVFH